MKAFFYCLSSFLLGAVITGLIGWRFFVGTVQMAELSNMRVHSQALELINKNEVEQLAKVSCFAIEVSLEYYQEDLRHWFLAIENAHGTPEMTKQLLLKTQKQIEREDVCKRA